jgi:hypothetical protein
MTLGFNKTPQPPEHVRRLVLHEFGHAIGLEHEHAHRQSGIKWNEDALVAYLRKGLPAGLTREQIIAQVHLFSAPGAQWGQSAYDVLSIMRYRFPKEVFSAGWQPEFDTENTTLSEGDKQAVQQMYPGRAPVSGGGTGFTKQQKIKAGDKVTDSIKQEQIHRYDFETEGDDNYAITTRDGNEDEAVVRIELLTKDGKRPQSVSLNVNDAKSEREGAYVRAYIPSGSYYVTVRSSPFTPGSQGEGKYNLKLEKKS